MKPFEKKEESPEKTRQRYGILCSLLGIGFNLLLFLGKFLAGTLSGSISITADAFNNLSDAASSVMTLLGFWLAGARADENHPFGHGRMEYLSGLAVCVAIFIMAFELLKSSVEKILHPTSAQYGTLALVILGVSILVKVIMFTYNRIIGKRIHSTAMEAVAIDSLSDCGATAVVLIAAILEKTKGIQLDGYGGLLVGAFICYAGYRTAKETISPLLGEAPDPDFVKEIRALVLSFDEIIGVHDLVVHDYGPGRRMISLHAEVPAEGDVLLLHDVIDTIEGTLRYTMHCQAVIQMDPVVTKDSRVTELKEKVSYLLWEMDGELHMHDFRVTFGPTHSNLIFDLELPFGFPKSEETVIGEIQKLIWEKIGANYYVAITVDRG